MIRVLNHWRTAPVKSNINKFAPPLYCCMNGKPNRSLAIAKIKTIIWKWLKYREYENFAKNS